MSKSVREVALNKRFDAVKVVNNIRRVKRWLAKHPFDAKTFNAINGRNCSIDALVGRTVVFDALTDGEVTQLRKDINKALTANEDLALTALREATVEYFASVEGIVGATVAQCTPDQMKYLGFKKDVALEAFASTQLPKGALDVERTTSALEQLAVIAEEIEESVPEVERDLDIEEPTYEDEKHDNPDELPQEDDEEDEPEDIEIPEDDDDDATDEDDDEDDEDEFSVYAWTKPHFQYVSAMQKSFLNNDPASLEVFGFTSDKAVNLIGKYQAVMPAYVGAIKKFVGLVEPETCTVESLLKGSIKCYKRIDRIVALIERFEPIRKALTETCAAMIGASADMYKAQATH